MENKVIAKEYVDKNFIHKDVIKKIRAEMYVKVSDRDIRQHYGKTK